MKQRLSPRVLWSSALWIVLIAGLLLRIGGALPRNLGLCYLSAALLGDRDEDIEKAAFWLENGRLQAGNPRGTANGLALLYIEQGRAVLALDVLAAAVEAGIRDPLTLTRLGWVHFDLGQEGEAIKVWREAGVSDYFVGLGRASAQAGGLEEGVRYYEIAAAIAPNSSAPYHALGRFYYDEKEWEQALTYYQRVLQLNPDDAGAVYFYARILHDGLSESDQALDLVDAAITSHKCDAEWGFEFLLLRGVILSSREDFQGALDVFEEAVCCQPSSERPLLALASVYNAMDLPDQAEVMFLRALEVNPEAPRTYREYGRFLQNRGDDCGAFDAYRQALELRPGDADLIELIARLDTSHCTVQ